MKNHQNLPPDMNKTIVKKGERIIYYESLTNIIVTKWEDKKDVHMISTFVNGEENGKRAGKDKNIPALLISTIVVWVE